jgi:putative Holliday junction resolvase
LPMDTGILMAFDYGLKKTGIAVTDPLQTIASALTTIPTPSLKDYVASYTQTHQVTGFVVGYPLQKDGTPSTIMPHIMGFARHLKGCYPHIPVYQQDERYTSKMAAQTLLAAGVKKMKRRDKTLLDKISASILLQSFLDTKTKTSL